MKRFFLIFLSIFAILNLLLWPSNKYEWMETEGMKILPEDSNSGFYALFALLPILILSGMTFVAKTKKEKLWILIISGVFLLYWIYKFLLK